MNSADTADERAKLALEELKRTGAFDRSILIVVMPTGTGWVDPAALDPVEYLHRGDIASVAMQYSYLASWLSLLVEPDYGAEAGNALFREVYALLVIASARRPPETVPSWPKPRRDEFRTVGEPLRCRSPIRFRAPYGAGRPFRAAPGDPLPTAAIPDRPNGCPVSATARSSGSPIRTMPWTYPDATWGPIRIVYLQYASDPITFFDVATLYREPDWMKEPRGPDVSAAGSLVSAHHDAATDGRHGDRDDISNGLRPCLCTAALHRCVDGRNRSAGYCT